VVLAELWQYSSAYILMHALQPMELGQLCGASLACRVSVAEYMATSLPPCPGVAWTRSSGSMAGYPRALCDGMWEEQQQQQAASAVPALFTSHVAAKAKAPTTAREHAANCSLNNQVHLGGASPVQWPPLEARCPLSQATLQLGTVFTETCPGSVVGESESGAAQVPGESVPQPSSSHPVALETAETVQNLEVLLDAGACQGASGSATDGLDVTDLLPDSSLQVLPVSVTVGLPCGGLVVQSATEAKGADEVASEALVQGHSEETEARADSEATPQAVGQGSHGAHDGAVHSTVADVWGAAKGEITDRSKVYALEAEQHAAGALQEGQESHCARVVGQCCDPAASPGQADWQAVLVAEEDGERPADSGACSSSGTGQHAPVEPLVQQSPQPCLVQGAPARGRHGTGAAPRLDEAATQQAAEQGQAGAEPAEARSRTGGQPLGCSPTSKPCGAGGLAASRRHATAHAPRTIWTYWDQGVSVMPAFNKLCVQSWHLRNPDWQVRVVDKRTLQDLVELEDLPPTLDQLKKPQHRADCAKLALLRRHGGVYIDSSVLMLRSLDEVGGWRDVEDGRADFAGYFRGTPDFVENWFLACRCDCQLVRSWLRTHLEFWRTRTAATNLPSDPFFKGVDLGHLEPDERSYLAQHACYKRLLDLDGGFRCLARGASLASAAPVLWLNQRLQRDGEAQAERTMREQALRRGKTPSCALAKNSLEFRYQKESAMESRLLFEDDVALVEEVLRQQPPFIKFTSHTYFLQSYRQDMFTQRACTAKRLIQKAVQRQVQHRPKDATSIEVCSSEGASRRATMHSWGTPKPEAMSQQEPAESSRCQVWEVVGGGSKGGLLVREKEDLSSALVLASGTTEESRVLTGSLVEQVALHGCRLKYRLLSGAGPESGWVSTRCGERDLLVRVRGPPPTAGLRDPAEAQHGLQH